MTLRVWKWAIDKGGRLKAYLYGHIQGRIVMLGVLVSTTLTIGAGIAGASHQYMLAITLFLLGIAIMKPTLLYLVTWVEERALRHSSHDAGPPDSQSDG